MDRGRGSSRRGRSVGGRGRGRGRLAPGQRPVNETTRISIGDMLAELQRSDEAEVTFPAGLSNHDRAVVHSEALKYGFRSKSTGKGAGRQVTVFKHHVNGDAKSTYEVPFTAESHRLVQEYLERFPPAEAEHAKLSLADMNVQSSEAAVAASQEHAASTHENGATARDGAHKKHKKSKLQLHSSAFFTAEDVNKRRAAWLERQQRQAVQDINAVRQALPIAAMRGEIVDAIQHNQVVLVAGETGCGKTTQLPQYILEDAWNHGKGCKVLCTQPRRISAITIAERVAAERGEKCGDNVGYSIRLESSGGAHSSLMFCTNGVLLRMLTQGEGLEGVTHIVADEIHERDRFADFLLIMLRQVLPSRPQLRLVLMSATLLVDLFSGYFGGCPVIQVPGFTHPVTDVYLEEILPMIGYKPAGRFAASSRAAASRSPTLSSERQAELDAAISDAFLRGTDEDFERLLEVTGAAATGIGPSGAPYVNARHSTTGGTALMVAAGKGRMEDAMTLLSNGANTQQTCSDGSSPIDWARRFGHDEMATFLEEHSAAVARADEATGNALLLSQYQATTDADEVDLNLIEALLALVCGEGPHAQPDAAAPILGAVLIFLPGWDEIIRLKEKLGSHLDFSTSRYQVLPLHSMVPAADQRKIFVRPPPGVRKIVLATNIAETAVTIDDIVCVINSGRMKEKGYDPYMAVSTLMSAWVSRAAEKQRRGRAGRCQPGVCFHLYTRQRSEALQEFQLPELQRTPLDELCLQVKLLEGRGFGSIMLAEFLAQAVEPPPLPSIRNAIQLLEDIGALEPQTEKLTLLGRHLAALPLPPRVGKMLLYGILFEVLDPILTVACCMAYRSPWVLPIESSARRLSLEAKQRLATAGGGCSDHLALVKAYQGWAASKAAGRHRQYAATMYINNATMEMVQGMREQLLGELQAQGFVRTVEQASSQAWQSGLVRSVLGAAFYPQFGHLIPMEQNGKTRGIKLLTAGQEKVKVHPASLNSTLSAPERGRLEGQPCRVLIFDEKTRSESTLHVMQTTLITPHLLLLVANRLLPPQQPLGMSDEEDSDGCGEDDEDWADDAQDGFSRVMVDGWLSLRLRRHILPAVATLRRRLTDCFAAKVANPRAALQPVHSELLRMLGALFVLEAQSSGLDKESEARQAAHLGSAGFSGAHRGNGAHAWLAAPQRGRGRGRSGSFPSHSPAASQQYPPQPYLTPQYSFEQRPSQQNSNLEPPVLGASGSHSHSGSGSSRGRHQGSGERGRGRYDGHGRGYLDPNRRGGRGANHHQQPPHAPSPGRGRGRGESPGAGRFGGRNLQGGRYQQRQLIGTARQQHSGTSDKA